jgi:hypothetical protein
MLRLRTTVEAMSSLEAMSSVEAMSSQNGQQSSRFQFGIPPVLTNETGL